MGFGRIGLGQSGKATSFHGFVMGGYAACDLECGGFHPSAAAVLGTPGLTPLFLSLFKAPSRRRTSKLRQRRHAPHHLFSGLGLDSSLVMNIIRNSIRTLVFLLLLVLGGIEANAQAWSAKLDKQFVSINRQM